MQFSPLKGAGGGAEKRKKKFQYWLYVPQDLISSQIHDTLDNGKIWIK